MVLRVIWLLLYSDAETMTSALLLRNISEEDRFWNQVGLIDDVILRPYTFEMYIRSWINLEDCDVDNHKESNRGIQAIIRPWFWWRFWWCWQVLEKAEKETKVMAIRGNRIPLQKLLAIISNIYSKKVFVFMWWRFYRSSCWWFCFKICDDEMDDRDRSPRQNFGSRIALKIAVFLLKNHRVVMRFVSFLYWRNACSQQYNLCMVSFARLLEIQLEPFLK